MRVKITRDRGSWTIWCDLCEQGTRRAETLAAVHQKAIKHVNGHRIFGPDGRG